MVQKKFVASQVKTFFVTRISGNKSIFLFDLKYFYWTVCLLSYLQISKSTQWFFSILKEKRTKLIYISNVLKNPIGAFSISNVRVFNSLKTSCFWLIENSLKRGILFSPARNSALWPKSILTKISNLFKQVKINGVMLSFAILSQYLLFTLNISSNEFILTNLCFFLFKQKNVRTLRFSAKKSTARAVLLKSCFPKGSWW